MSLFDFDDYDNEAAELRAEVAAERRERARLYHWCDVCHGHTGPGSPCYAGPEDEPEEEDSPYCQGCNPEPTLDELDSGVCASCGKELA